MRGRRRTEKKQKKKKREKERKKKEQKKERKKEKRRNMEQKQKKKRKKEKERKNRKKSILLYAQLTEATTLNHGAKTARNPDGHKHLQQANIRADELVRQNKRTNLGPYASQGSRKLRK